MEYTGDTTVDTKDSSTSSPSTVRSPVKSNSLILHRSNSYNSQRDGGMFLFLEESERKREKESKFIFIISEFPAKQETNFENEGDFNGNIARWILAKYHKLKVF